MICPNFGNLEVRNKINIAIQKYNATNTIVNVNGILNESKLDSKYTHNIETTIRFNEIKDILGENAAYTIWNLQNGNNIELTANGEKSLLFEKLENKYGRISAIIGKGIFYNDKLLSNGENEDFIFSYISKNIDALIDKNKSIIDSFKDQFKSINKNVINDTTENKINLLISLPKPSILKVVNIAENILSTSNSSRLKKDIKILLKLLYKNELESFSEKLLTDVYTLDEIVDTIASNISMPEMVGTKDIQELSNKVYTLLNSINNGNGLIKTLVSTLRTNTVFEPNSVPGFTAAEQLSITNTLSVILGNIGNTINVVNGKRVRYKDLTIGDILDNPQLSIDNKLILQVKKIRKQLFKIKQSKSLSADAFTSEIKKGQIDKLTNQILLWDKVLKDLRNNDGEVNLFNIIRRRTSEIFGIVTHTYSEIEDLLGDDVQSEELKLTRIYNQDIIYEDLDKTFRPETKLAIAKLLEYDNVDGIYRPTINQLTGYFQFVDYDITYKKLLDILNGSTTLVEMIAKLEGVMSFMPQVRDLIKQIKTNKDFAESFYTDFAKVKLDEEYILIDNTGQVKLKTANKDSSVYKTFEWVTHINYKMNNKATDLKTFINWFNSNYSTFIKSFQNDEISIPELIGKIVYFYNGIGIDLDEEVLDNYVKYINSKDYIVSDLLFINFIKPFAEIINNLNGKKFTGFGVLNRIAKIYNSFYTGDISHTYYDIEGNPKQSIRRHSVASRFFSTLKSNDDNVRSVLAKKLLGFSKDNSFGYSNWLFKTDWHEGLLDRSNNEFKLSNSTRLFNFKMFGGVEDKVNNSTTKYLNMTSSKFMNAKFFNYVHNIFIGKNMVNLPLLIQGDSSQLYTITVPRFILSSGDYSLKNGNLIFNKDSVIYKALLNMFMQEYTAMKDSANSLFHTDPISGKLTNYDSDNALLDYHYKLDRDGKKIFINKEGKVVGNVFKYSIFTKLNSIDDLFNSDGTPRPLNDELIDKVMEAIGGSIYSDFKYSYNMLDQSKENYLDNKLEINFPEHYVHTNNAKSDKITMFKRAVLEMVINERITNTEVSNFMFSLPSKFDDLNKVVSRAKRMTQMGNLQMDDTDVNVVVLQDIVLPAEDLTTLESAVKQAMSRFDVYSKNNNLTVAGKRISKFILDSYSNIVTSDGAGFMTLKRWSIIQHKLGRSKEYAYLYKTYDLENKNFELRDDLTLDELTKVIQAVKPIYSDTDIHTVTSNYSVVKGEYLKYASYPLIEQVTKHIPYLDTLRVAMEKSNVDEVVFQSTEKEGGINPVKVDDNGVINEDALNSALHNEQRKFKFNSFVNQLDVPDHARNTQNKLGLQLQKFILANSKNTFEIPELLSNLRNLDSRLLAIKLNIQGSEMDLNKLSSILTDEFQKRHMTTDDIESIQVEDRLVNLTDEEYEKYYNDTVELYRTLYNISDEELQEFYDKYETTDYEDLSDKEQLIYGALNNIHDTKNEQKFRYNIDLGKLNKRTISVFNSLFKNNVTDTKFPGGHLVLISNAMSVGTSDNLKYEYKNGTYYAEAEISLPANIYKQYVNPDGTPKSNMAKELRTLIGYRIPNTGKHSMVILNVKKFLPAIGGSIARLPSELITQTGWDFDVDSLFLLRRNHKIIKTETVKVNKNGKEIKTFTTSLEAKPTMYMDYTDYVQDAVSQYKHLTNTNKSLETKSQVINKSILNIKAELRKIYKAREELTAADIQKYIKDGTITKTNDKGELCAANGITSTTTGTGWKIVKDFKGQPKHSQGGVDITISDKGVTMRRGGKDIKAAHGLFLPMCDPTNPNDDHDPQAKKHGSGGQNGTHKSGAACRRNIIHQSFEHSDFNKDKKFQGMGYKPNRGLINTTKVKDTKEEREHDSMGLRIDERGMPIYEFSKNINIEEANPNNINTNNFIYDKDNKDNYFKQVNKYNNRVESQDDLINDYDAFDSLVEMNINNGMTPKDAENEAWKTADEYQDELDAASKEKYRRARNINIVRKSFDESADDYRNYANDPQYKKRLSMEMFGIDKDKLSKSQNKKLDKEYNDRLLKLKDINSSKVSKIPYTKKYTRDGSYKANKDRYASNAQSIVDYHEITHSVDASFKKYGINNDDKGYKKKLNEIMKTKKGVINDRAFNSPEEVKARLDAIRIQAIKDGYYNQNEEFDIRKLDKVNDYRQLQDLKRLLKLSNDDINELMKYVAQNTDTKDTSNIA